MPSVRPFHVVGPWLAALFLVTALAAPASAQAPSKVKTFRLEPKKMPGIEHGKAAVVKGEAGPEPHRFLVEGLTALMPVTVLLRPVRDDDTVGIRLTKYAWNEPLREGEADGKPIDFKIRTEGEFQIAVSAKEAKTPYRLLVWVGDEVKPTLTPVVVKASQYKGTGGAGGAGAVSGGGNSLVLWVIAATLMVGVSLLAVLVFRRKS